MKHFLDIFDNTSDELQELLDLAIHLKAEYFLVCERESRLTWQCDIWVETHCISPQMRLV
jgi:ornithine carbamoyltransferase